MMSASNDTDSKSIKDTLEKENGRNYLFKYNVDMVFCIDATASMRPVINTVKN
mgnify:CR=1 FL=1